MPDRTRGRCAWAGQDPLNVAYHDLEWGRPERDERRLFEALTLEGAQAGLSWLTILRKRDAYRQAFAGFDPVQVSRFDSDTIGRLLTNPGIVRHRGKIESTINNACRILELHERGTSLSELVWDTVDGETIVNAWTGLAQVPATTPRSAELSKRLKQAGFRFVGPTTCYAFMQAAGLVNDHEVSCFRHPSQEPD